jgi:O-antigen/teichoic acid export membrane protein
LALKRDLMLVGGGRLAAALMALVTIRAVTTFLTPEQFGELALLIAVQMFCGLFLVNPVGQHINLHTHAWWDDGTLLARLKSYRHYVLAVSFVGAGVVLGIGQHHSAMQLLWTLISMFAMVAAGTWNATLIPMLNMLGFRAISIFWSILTIATGLVSSILLVVWSQSATAWFAGQAIGMGVGALGAKYVLRQHAKQSELDVSALPLLDKRTILSYCLPLALATGLMWLQLSGYRFAIESYWGLAQLGFLAVGLQLAGQIWGLAESLSTQFLYPLFYRRVSAHENLTEVDLAFSDLLNTLVPVYLVLAGLTILSAPYLLKLLVAPQFRDALNFVMLGAGIELCRVLGNLFSNAAHIRRKTKSLALPYAVGSMTSLGLIYCVGVRQMEINWVGVALIVGAFAMLMTMLTNMYRQVKFSLDVTRCFLGFLMMLAMASAAFWIPRVSGFGANIGILLLVAMPAGIVVCALLWKNPATLRLLNAQLRKY